jgi:predicted O-linked N-acetylglucosamine transferase (SPINDLY family)
VSYQHAFAAFEAGDFTAAAGLLEKAAEESGYTSDIINHAYTLALHHTGDKASLARAAYRVGKMLRDQDPASAMDYFQRATFAGLDATSTRDIGEWFEHRATPVAAKSAISSNTPVSRVAHVVGCLQPDHPPAQYLRLLVSSLQKAGIESIVFTTEWAASWFFNPSGVAQSQAAACNAEVRIASVEGDFEERAVRIANELRESGIRISLFHANLSEQITARVASLRPTPVQVNVAHDSEMDTDLFDARIHLFENSMRQTRFVGPAVCIPIASDIQAKLQMAEPVSRQSMGLESAGSVTATFGNLRHASSRDYLRVLVEIMNRFPKNFHLFAGSGNVRAIRSFLHAEGVLPRVRFLGQPADCAPLVDMIDVYLTPFPEFDVDAVLEAMGAGKPVAALRYSPESRSNSAAELVGIRDLTASAAHGYIEVVDGLLRSSALRQTRGQAVLERFRAEFRPDRLGERYKAFLAQL